MIKEIRIFKIKNKKFESFNKTLIIAEIGSNHNQNFSKAKKLIDIAANSGCDAVKFQLFEADKIIQKKYRGWKILKKLEINKKWLMPLKKYANKKKLFFGISVFDLENLHIIKKLNVDFIKIASTEIQDLLLVEKCSKLKKPLILSTGGATMTDISLAVDIVREHNSNFCILHTVSIYPAKVGNLNLQMMKSLSGAFGLPVGFSDHSTSCFIPSIAVTLGACVIEKHITYNKLAKGPDHFFALSPEELKKMIVGVREAEKSFGNIVKQPAIKNERKGLARRIILKKDYFKNEKIKLKDLIIKRGDEKGILALDIEKIIGLKIKFNIKADEVLKWKYFK